MPHLRGIGWATCLLLLVGCHEKAPSDPRSQQPKAATPSPDHAPSQPNEGAQPPSEETKTAWDALQYEAPAETLAASPSPTTKVREGLQPMQTEARPPSSVPLAPAPGSDVSETDTRRAAGAVEFEREIMGLSVKADQADIAWQRYVAGCHLDVTHVEAGAAAGGRTWFAAAWSSATSTRLSDACAEAGTFFALVNQVKRGMCIAEDAARHAAVYPGTRRDLRRKYRMDWDGWDRICS